MVSMHLQAQRFLALVLLPHVRQNVQENKRLHFALFQAMKKAAFKPDAFYKVCSLPKRTILQEILQGKSSTYKLFLDGKKSS